MIVKSDVSNEEITSAVEGQTIPSVFAATVAARGAAPALRWKVAGGDDWAEWSWAEYGRRAAQVATGLDSLGLRRGERVCLMMRNRPEFHPIDMGVLLAGGTPISIYNSSSPEQVQYLVDHCEATVAVVEDAGFLSIFEKVRQALPALREVVLIDHEALWGPAGDLDELAARAQPGDLATVIYTSGTTGPPKGVMLSHFNVCWTMESLMREMAISLAGRRMVSYLPMAHIAERVFTHCLPAREGAVVTPCADGTAIGGYLRDVRPEAFFGPPRVWEKMAGGLQAAMAANDQLTADAARAMVGLDAVEIAISGAAPTPVEVLEFFHSIGVPLSEVYGQSEDSGPMTWDAHEVRVGTVGRPIPGCDVKLLDDGEICCRGGNVFQGYLKDPEKTAEILDADGWLHSGDIGVVDGDGYLRIVDRKKELIITAGGKNISPANIEAALKSLPLVGQACVIGDNRPYVTALLVLDPDIAPVWAKQHDIDAASLPDLAADARVVEEVGRGVEEINARFSNVEKVKKFALVGDEWLPDSDLLTPTMKLKRRGVLARYEADIDALYR